jgi:hypothetical protein
MEAQVNNQGLADLANETKTDITADDKKFVKLLSSMKAEVKKLSHNELARQFTSLYAQYILLQSKYDMLEERSKKQETTTLPEQQGNSGESND